jgi:hypothetical protein
MNPNPQRPTIPGPVQRKVFDVMRPGRAPANSTSKPVIVGHKPQVQDPSVTVNGVGEARPLLDSRKKISITAHDGDTAAGQAPKPPVPAIPSLPKAAPEVPVAAPATMPEPQSVVPPSPEGPKADDGPSVWPSRDEQPPVTPEVSVSAGVSPAETVTSSIPEDTAPQADAVAPTTPEPAMPEDDLLATMPAPEVDDHHAPSAEPSYVGPRTIPWRLLIPIIVILVLAIAIVDILLDADFLSWSIPHTHFL